MDVHAEDNCPVERIGCGLTISVNPDLLEPIPDSRPTTNAIQKHPHFREARVEASSFRTTGTYAQDKHGLLQAVHTSFCRHYPLELKPDHFWIAIAQGIALHERATGIFGKMFPGHLSSEHKKKIVIRRDEFVLGSESNDWEGLFPEFAEKIRPFLPDGVFDLFYGTGLKFSTSDVKSQVVLSVIWMDTMQKYFDFCCCTCCGMPEIVLRGTREDWALLESQMQTLLTEYGERMGLSVWFRAILPILHQFVLAWDGCTPKEFWNSMYKYRGARGSGGVPKFSGWLHLFFPYQMVNSRVMGRRMRGEEEQEEPAQKYLPRFTGSDFLWHAENPGQVRASQFDPKSLPNGIASAPFTWDYYGRELKMRVSAGLLGSDFSEETGAIGATLGWAVTHEQ